MKLRVIAVLLWLVENTKSQNFGEAIEIYSWTALDYDWPNDTVKDSYVTSGRYIVDNNIITGIKLHEGQVYLTVPRWRHGVPSTLNRVVEIGGKPLLQPFPSWEMQTEGDCFALQYVQSMEVDPNTGFMWIIDNGRIHFRDVISFHSHKCPPKLLIYDLKRRQEVKRFIFPDHVANRSTCFLNDIVLDYMDGQVAYAYITDTSDAKIYVYDNNRNEAYYFSDPSMQSEPAGQGTPVDGIAMSADFMFLYYCPIDGHGLFQIPTFVLRDRQGQFGLHVRRVGTRVSRSDGLTYSQKNLYYGLLELNGVQRWQSFRDATHGCYDDVVMTTVEDVTHNDVGMRWVDTFGWDDESGYLWFTANDLSRFMDRSMDFTGAAGKNMYVWKIFVNETSYLSRASSRTHLSTCIPETPVG